MQPLPLHNHILDDVDVWELEHGTLISLNRHDIRLLDVIDKINLRIDRLKLIDLLYSRLDLLVLRDAADQHCLLPVTFEDLLQILTLLSLENNLLRRNYLLLCEALVQHLRELQEIIVDVVLQQRQQWLTWMLAQVLLCDAIVRRDNVALVQHRERFQRAHIRLAHEARD